MGILHSLWEFFPSLGNPSLSLGIFPWESFIPFLSLGIFPFPSLGNPSLGNAPLLWESPWGITFCSLPNPGILPGFAWNSLIFPGCFLRFQFVWLRGLLMKLYFSRSLGIVPGIPSQGFSHGICTWSLPGSSQEGNSKGFMGIFQGFLMIFHKCMTIFQVFMEIFQGFFYDIP